MTRTFRLRPRTIDLILAFVARTTATGLASSIAGAAGAATADVPPDRPPEQGRLALVPVVLPAYQKETSFVLAGAGVVTYQYPNGSDQRESQMTLAVAATLKRQYTALLTPDVYLWEGRVNVVGTASASRFPDLFFGMGSHTRSEDEESFTPIYYELESILRLRARPGLYIGPSARLLRANISSTVPGALLDGGGVPGSRGGDTVQLGLSAFWDTRDRTLYPRRGTILQADLRSARRAWASDFSFDVLSVDCRHYISLPWTDHVLALQAIAELRRGILPFYDTGRMGGNKMMRGYFQGRFRDRQYLAAQIEYRRRLIGRLGAVAFASVGEVAYSLGDARLGDAKVAGGTGLRFAPMAAVPVNVRLDVAYGNQLLFYLNVGEAF